jgi:hypothetical protein
MDAVSKHAAVWPLIVQMGSILSAGGRPPAADSHWEGHQQQGPLLLHKLRST